ncbi:MAG: 23S rRNA (guanosine(2251)-2'-O)-methyltransferase RlmB [Acidobacteriota bacterium]|nr:23S rRNA (guanosine(2251)-2'-O)-methyltransferase RlmB [Acidobacteriota bacterium]
MPILIGVHPVVEALRARHSIERILISKGAGGPRLQEIIDLARQSFTPIRFEDRGALDRLAGTRSHQGVVALGAESKYAAYDGTIETARLVVVLDGVEDPHNLGAIVRTAHAAGADTVVVPERRAAGLTETVAKAAAGALEYLPITRVTNVNRTLEDLKKRGFWIYGVDQRGTEIYNQVAWAEPAAIVLGGEGKGLHEQVRRHCDLLVRIPMAGKISSLNVSVAAGVVLFAFRAGQTESTPNRVTPRS